MNEREIKWNNLFDNLPDDIKEHIYYNFLHKKSLIFLNKNNYKKYHRYLINYIKPENYLYYIKYTIENNLVFVFNQLLDEMFLKWIKMKHLYFNNKLYPNMIKLILNEFCDSNNNIEIINLIQNKINFYSINKIY